MIHNHEVRSSILRPATLKIHGKSSTCNKLQVLFSCLCRSDTVLPNLLFLQIRAHHRQVGEFPARDLLGVRRPRKKAQLFVGEFVAVVDILHDGLVVARNDPLDGRNDELLLQRNGQRREELLQVGRRLHQLHEGRQHRRLHEGCQVDGRAGRAVKHPTRRTKKRMTLRSSFFSSWASAPRGEKSAEPGTFRNNGTASINGPRKRTTQDIGQPFAAPSGV